MNSKEFDVFRDEHPQAKLCAGFFIKDFVTGIDEKTLDYLEGDNVYTVSLNHENEVSIKDDTLLKIDGLPKLSEITPIIKTELDVIPTIVETALIKNNIKSKVDKIISVLQNHEDKQVWNLTVMLDGFLIINIIIDDLSGEVIKFDRKNMRDFIKK